MLALFIILLLIIPISFQFKQPQDSPWPVVGHDLRHSGISQYETILNEGRIKWKLFLEGGRGDVTTTPVIDKNGIVYIGVANPVHGILYAVYPNGTIKWKYRCSGIWESPAIAEDGTVYFTSFDGKLYALDSEGNLKWKYDTGLFCCYEAPCIGPDGTIYFSAHSWEKSYLYAVLPNGNLKWKFETVDYVGSVPAIYNNTIYFADMHGYLYALDFDGNLKWIFDLKYKSLCNPSVDKNGVIYCSTNFFGGINRIYAIYPNGTLKWEWRSRDGGIFGVTPGFAITNDTIYFSTYEGNLYALDFDGNTKWYVHLPTSYPCSPYPTLPAVGKEGTIWIAGTRMDRGNGPEYVYLYAFTPDGKKKYEIKLVGDIPYFKQWPGSPSIAKDGTIYVATAADALNNFDFGFLFGYLYAIREGIEKDIIITRPKVPYLYIFDREITKLNRVESIIIGGITVETEVKSEKYVEKVEFYTDDQNGNTPPKLRYIDYSPPFKWKCKIKAFDKKEWRIIIAKAYYSDGDAVVDIAYPLKFFNLFGEE